MTILPHHIAGVFLVAGLGTGGYFAVRAVTPPSLEEKLTSLNLELETNWENKAAKYNEDNNPNKIPNIEQNKANVNQLEEELKKWCEKKKKKPFWDNLDPTYKNFSIWCTASNTIKQALTKRGLRELNQEEWTKKLETYNADATNNFITAEAGAENKVKKWCETSEKTTYTYEGDETVKRVLTWCYSN